MSNEEDIDYEQNQKLALENLSKCQSEQNLTSCMPCSKLLDCETRDKFVKATYSKMNKGEEGGFEF